MMTLLKKICEFWVMVVSAMQNTSTCHEVNKYCDVGNATQCTQLAARPIKHQSLRKKKSVFDDFKEYDW